MLLLAQNEVKTDFKTWESNFIGLYLTLVEPISNGLTFTFVFDRFQPYPKSSPWFM